MIQTLHSLSQLNPLPSGAPPRGPVKEPAGGFALALHAAPGQLSQEPATPTTAQKTPQMAPGIDLTSLLRGAAPVLQGSAKMAETAMPEVGTPTGDVDVTLIATGSAAPTAAIAPGQIADAGLAPVATSGIALHLPTVGAAMIDDAAASLPSGVTHDGQSADDGISDDSAEGGMDSLDVDHAGDGDAEGFAAIAALSAPASSTTAMAITSDADGVTQYPTSPLPVAPPAEAATSSDVTAKSAGAPEADSTAVTDMIARPAAPESGTGDASDLGKAETADQTTGQNSAQTTGQNMGQNSGQNPGQQPGKTSDQQPTDTASLPLPAEAQAPATPSIPVTGSVQAPSAAQFDIGQQITTPTAGPVLDTQDPNWTDDLGLIAEEVLRTGAGELELKLNPEKLGAMTLRIDMTDGRASVTIVTETPEAAKLMLDNQFRLSEQMQRSGFDLNQTVSHNAMSGGSEGHHSRRGGTPGSEGRGQGQDQQNTMPNADETRTMPRSGVDLVA